MKCFENKDKYDILKTSIRRYNMKICFVRHGQTDANKNGLIQGVSDHPLNETGIKQAKEAAKLIKKKFPYFNAIISSSLSRAKKTAEVIKEDLKFKGEIIIDDHFIERSFGPYENHKVTDEVYIKLTSENTEGLEPFKDLQKRGIEGILELEKKYKGKNIIIATHAQILKAIVCFIDPKFDFKTVIYNGSLNIISVKNQKMKIEKLNIY
jgi:uncharacterized phosphatase